MSEEWFILQFKTNSHHLATKNLLQQGFKTFLPLHQTTSRKISRFKDTLRPLFPGYMFISFDRAKSEWHKINNTRGVSRLVTFDSSLKAIPTTFIYNLMERCSMSGELLPVKNLKKGDQVEIFKGPFTDFIASIETYENDQRIWILIDLMGRKTKVQTSAVGLNLSQ